MKLSRQEQETIIIFNEADAMASIQVHNGRLLRRLEQLHISHPDDVSIDHIVDYVIPKGWLRINPKIILSEEERERRANRFKRRV